MEFSSNKSLFSAIYLSPFLGFGLAFFSADFISIFFMFTDAKSFNSINFIQSSHLYKNELHYLVTKGLTIFKYLLINHFRSGLNIFLAILTFLAFTWAFFSILARFSKECSVKLLGLFSVVTSFFCILILVIVFIWERIECNQFSKKCSVNLMELKYTTENKKLDERNEKLVLNDVIKKTNK